MLVKDLVIRETSSIDAGKDIIDAILMMLSTGERILPVMDESTLVGAISSWSYARVLRDMMERKPESILVSELMDSRPRTFSPLTDVRQVRDKLCEKGVYGVPITSGHEFVGMVRRRDMLGNFKSTLKGRFKVMDVMSLHASTNSIHDTVESVARKIISGDERRVIIMNQDRIEGILTIIDLANILLAEKADLSNMSVRDILVPNRISVKKHDDATKPLELMLEWDVRGVPVMEEKLEGIVRDKDIIQRIRV